MKMPIRRIILSPPPNPPPAHFVVRYDHKSKQRVSEAENRGKKKKQNQVGRIKIPGSGEKEKISDKLKQVTEDEINRNTASISHISTKNT